MVPTAVMEDLRLGVDSTPNPEKELDAIFRNILVLYDGNDAELLKEISTSSEFYSARYAAKACLGQVFGPTLRSQGEGWKGRLESITGIYSSDVHLASIDTSDLGGIVDSVVDSNFDSSDTVEPIPNQPQSTPGEGIVIQDSQPTLDELSRLSGILEDQGYDVNDLSHEQLVGMLANQEPTDTYKKPVQGVSEPYTLDPTSPEAICRLEAGLDILDRSSESKRRARADLTALNSLLKYSVKNIPKGLKHHWGETKGERNEAGKALTYNGLTIWANEHPKLIRTTKRIVAITGTIAAGIGAYIAIKYGP